MIGVIADPVDHEVVREFFELFKTPWEFYREENRYDVVVCSGDVWFDVQARLLVVYAGRKTSFDQQWGIPIAHQRTDACVALWRGDRVPIYGDSVSFREGSSLLAYEDSRESATHLASSGDTTLCRVGYDLFAEIRSLLSSGQPAAYAAIPTLELHIAFLRQLIIGSEIQFVEIPPVPKGYKFIVCLTHDVDHPSMRQHKWDHTAAGFLYRATVGCLIDFVRRRASFREVLSNWAAAVKLPFVYLGIATDFWQDFAERYIEIENDHPSTFFVIPFKGRPGKNASGRQAKLRGASYGASDITDSIQKLRAAKREIGLHGIDAWVDEAAAREELAEIRRLTGVQEIGVRMHWLLYGEQSASILESAGATYDSSVGYNETVGYRAGTTQAYKPIGTSSLLELPLHVMDTALFYPAYLGMSPAGAGEVLRDLASKAARFGGCITINWHDRSTAPERLWDSPYRQLITDLQNQGAWFASAAQVVAWFRKRRSAVPKQNEIGKLDSITPEQHDRTLPGLNLQTHGNTSFSSTADLSSVAGSRC